MGSKVPYPSDSESSANGFRSQNVESLLELIMVSVMGNSSIKLIHEALEAKAGIL